MTTVTGPRWEVPVRLGWFNPRNLPLLGDRAVGLWEFFPKCHIDVDTFLLHRFRFRRRPPKIKAPSLAATTDTTLLVGIKKFLSPHKISRDRHIGD